MGDIHDELDITVYRTSSRSDHFLGKIKIPLHRVRQTLISRCVGDISDLLLQLRMGAQQYALKDKHSLYRSRGVLHIETCLAYNPVRAMVRTINPREVKVLEAEHKFKKKVMCVVIMINRACVIIMIRF